MLLAVYGAYFSFMTQFEVSLRDFQITQMLFDSSNVNSGRKNIINKSKSLLSPALTNLSFSFDFHSSCLLIHCLLLFDLIFKPPFSLLTLLWPPMESTPFYNFLLLSPFCPVLLMVVFFPPRYPEESSRLSPSAPGSFHHGPSPQ